MGLVLKYDERVGDKVLGQGNTSRTMTLQESYGHCACFWKEGSWIGCRGVMFLRHLRSQRRSCSWGAALGAFSCSSVLRPVLAVGLLACLTKALASCWPGQVRAHLVPSPRGFSIPSCFFCSSALNPDPLPTSLTYGTPGLCFPGHTHTVQEDRISQTPDSLALKGEFR